MRFRRTPFGKAESEIRDALLQCAVPSSQTRQSPSPAHSRTLHCSSSTNYCTLQLNFTYAPYSNHGVSFGSPSPPTPWVCESGGPISCYRDASSSVVFTHSVIPSFPRSLVPSSPRPLVPSFPRALMPSYPPPSVVPTFTTVKQGEMGEMDLTTTKATTATTIQIISCMCACGKSILIGLISATAFQPCCALFGT